MPTAGGIYYHEHGRSLDAEQSIILLHGAGGVYQQWPYRLRRWPNYRVLAPDLPGHGRSAGQASDSIPGYAAWLGEWMEALELDGAVLVGHSMGAAICLSLALTQPEQVSGLVLIGGGAKFPVNPKLMEDLWIPVKAQAAIHMMVGWSFGRESDEALRREYARQLLRNPPGLLYKDLVACSRVDMSKALAQIESPALILCGSEDRMMPAKHSIFLKEGLRRARFQEVEGGGHMIMQEKCKEVVAEIEKFLKTL